MGRIGQIPWNKGIKTGLVPRSAFKKGFTPWNKGKKMTYKHGMLNKHHTKEANEKNRLAHLGNVGELNPNWKGGKPKCEDCKKQLSNYGYLRCRSCSQKLRMSDPKEVRKVLRRREMSGLEKRVNEIIKKNELPYKFVGNGEFMIENKNPDFVNTNGEKKAVEVFWKRHKDQFRGGCEKWKNERSNLFEKYGWKLIFIEGTGLTEGGILKSLK